MELNPTIYSTLAEINWFSRCGMPPNSMPFHVRQLKDVAEAIALARADNWREAGTAAQGDLTAYLARYHSDAHGGYWNQLATASRARLKNEVMPKVSQALTRISADVLSDLVLLDLNRIAIQSAYQKRFKRIPNFYERLCVVYQAGYLPCGWEGDITAWPTGKLIIF
jgi:hypothetical protein